MEGVRFFKIMFFRTIPLYIFILFLIFFFVYQLAIGNRFMEDIDPLVILGVFIVFLSFTTFFLSTFYMVEKNGNVYIRLGLYFDRFSLKDVGRMEKISKEYSFGMGVYKNGNTVVFDLGGSRGIKLVLNSGREIVFFGKEFFKILKI